MDNNKITRPYVKNYFLVWFLFLITSYILLIFNSVLFFVIIIAYLLWYANVLINGENRFVKYIKSNHKDVWEEKGVRPSRNPFKWWGFIKSKEDYGDPTLIIVKKNLKYLYYFHILHILTIPLIVLLLPILNNIIVGLLKLLN